MSDSKNYSLSVLLPGYNDKGTIASMVLEAKKTAEKLSDDFEIIVIDDYSTDGSQELLLELKKSAPELRLILHHRKQGYGSALKSGFAAAQKDIICYTDGDAQYDIRELPKLLEKLSDGADMVTGYKVRSNDPFHRIIVSAIYQYLVRLVFWLPVSDPDCDFRIMKRSALNNISLESDSGVISVELLKKAQNAGLKLAEVGVSHYFRMYGKSQALNIKRIMMIVGRLGSLWAATVWRSEK